MQLVNLDITLVNSVGENTFVQLINVSPNLDSQLPVESDEEEDATGEVVEEDASYTAAEDSNSNT